MMLSVIAVFAELYLNRDSRSEKTELSDANFGKEFFGSDSINFPIGVFRFAILIYTQIFIYTVLCNTR